MSLARGELLRKLVHVSMGLFALALRWLSWREAALAALAALAFNAFLLPRLGGRALHREADERRGYPVGILLYPAVVLALVLLFRDDLAIAAAGWGLLAFGDGFAGLLGQALGGPRTPWNRSKSWAGLAGYVVFGGAAAALLFAFVSRRPPGGSELAALFVAAALGAAVESLPSELDDNLAAPLLATAALAALLPACARFGVWAEGGGPRALAVAAGVNLAVSLLAGAARLVRPSGVPAGFLLGTLVLGLGGAGAYALLWLFFAAGTLATRFGKARKEAMGKAEAHGGRRGAAHALANVSVAAFAASVAGLLGPAGGAAFLVAAAGALATALMDTVGTEVGQAIASPTVLLPDLKPVPPGTDGAVSVAGTLAGAAGAALVGGVALAAGIGRDAPLATLAAVVGAAALGTVAESLLGRDGAPWRVSNGHVLNFYNTAVGATAAFFLSRAFR